MELQLQAILSLQRIEARQQGRLDDASTEIRRLRADARSGAAYARGRAATRMADKLQGEIPAMEAQVMATHAEIARLAAELSDTDLSYLHPSLPK